MNSRMLSARLWATVLLTITLIAPTYLAAQQIYQGTILGTVRDPSGKVVPGASVTVTNTGTNGQRTMVTDDHGNYLIPALNTGSYSVTVRMRGFRDETISGIVLSVNQQARVDMQLKLGSSVQQITVTQQAPLLHTDDAIQEQLINGHEITSLPIPLDRNIFELALLGAGMSVGPASSVTTGQYGAGFGIAAMGQKVQNNYFTLDGAPLSTAMFNQVRMRPSVEALSEFKVESASYPADLGHESGAQVISVIRPGTNNFHGTLFEFLRNDAFDARTFFEDPTLPKAPLQRNDFGGVLSGPIIRNKLFFTINYEGYLQHTKSQSFAVYPDAAMKAGDLNEPYFSKTPIINPQTGQPFPGNVIPISPQAQKLMQFFPTPNYGSAVFNGESNYTGYTVSNNNDEQGFARLDYTIDDKDTLFGHFGEEKNTFFNQQVNPNPFFGQNAPRNQNNDVITWTRMISPTELNQFSISYNRDIWGSHDTVPSGFSIANNLLIPGLDSDPYVQGVPSISITGLTALGNATPTTIWDENRRLADDFSFAHGSHQFKVGMEYERLLVRRQSYTYVTGVFDFNGSITGSPWSDFLLDQPYQVEEAVAPATPIPGFSAGETYVRLADYHLQPYFMDDWKATPKLTINYGLRWELDSPIQDIRGLTDNINMSTGQLFPAPGVSGNLYDWDHHDFAPRFGFAYRPFSGSNATVVRGSYGVYYTQNMWNNISVMASNPPFNLSIDQVQTPGNVTVTMANPADATSIVGSETPEILGVPKDYGLANSQQWTFNIEHVLPQKITLEVGYVGSKSTHFDRPAEYNDINVLAGQTEREFPQYSDIELIDTDAYGTYNGLITRLEKHLSNGISFVFTYTYSKDMFSSFSGNGALRMSDPFDAKAEKGLGEPDMRHRITMSWLYELPFYRNHTAGLGHFLGGWHANGVFTWQTGMPFEVTQSVQPVNDGCSRCNEGDSRRPDLLFNPTLSNPTLNEWFNTSAFRVALGHYGDEGRNILTGPGLTDVDLALYKNIRITESKTLQLRLESYDLFNTPPFDQNPPDGVMEDGTFGEILGSGPGRELQLALRFMF